MVSFDLNYISAFSDPTRVQIVELLRGGPLTVGNIANKLRLRQPQTSKHLKILNERRILNVKSEANKRVYSINDEAFKNLSEWAQTFIRVMDERYDKLDVYLEQIQTTKKPRRKVHEK